MLCEEDIIRFAKWIRKQSGSKKRFVYAGKLTKTGALVVVVALTQYTCWFLRKFEEYQNENCN